jgi:type III pantothenate kinase
MTAASAAMRLIAVDIGNSSTKVGWFDAASDGETLPQPVMTVDFPTGQTPLEEIARQLPAEPCRWLVASVQREGQRVLTKWVATHRHDDELHVLGYRDLPLEVRADVPDKVGVDRLAAAVAANATRDPSRPCIVIDAGSAVTVDLVSAAGSFEGGVILAGFKMQGEALFGGADQLPLTVLAPNDQPPPVLGKNTEAAIRSGLFWGAVGSVREIVAGLSAPLNPPPQVIVTGGDLRQLAKHLGGEARYVPNLVLAGIALAARSR